MLVVYDCLFPHTIGGAERWYRNLAERLASEGHDVTYLTLRQWMRHEDPSMPGVKVVAAGPQMNLYVDGRRRIAPPLVFGGGVFWHLLLHGRRYDVVHTASFPYFSLLAAGMLRRPGGYRLVVDWHELWSREYWREYLGPLGGRIGWLVQLAGVRLRQSAFCFARLTAQRLRAESVRGDVTVLEGEYEGPLERAPARPAEQLVVFAGRHIPEKRVPALVPALAIARKQLPELRAVIFGDGPERQAVQDAVREHGLSDAVEVPGFASSEVVDATLSRALCMVLPSRREGYGMIVVESAAASVPSVVCAAPDNAAVELVEPGVNGVVAPNDSPEALASAILEIHRLGPALRESTGAWFDEHRERLSLAHSLGIVTKSYAA